MSYVSSYQHCVFSTKERRPLITPDLQERLWPYLGGIAREHKMMALEIGGVADHVHMLLSLPSSMAIAKGLQLIKAVHPSGCMIRFPNTACSAGR
jgi:putative transposase